MYTVPYFNEKDDAVVLEFMKNNPFVTITGFDGEKPVATHIPVEVEIAEDGSIVLFGHMMRKTDHHLAFEKNNRVMAIFQGPHCYVSASWYSNPLSGSTWNYISVQASGILEFTDEAGTLDAVRRVTDRFEGKETAAAFDQLPDSYVQSMVKAIVGFRIKVTHTGNVFKLSQNRDEVSYNNIIGQLRKRADANSNAIAGIMEARAGKLFGEK